MRKRDPNRIKRITFLLEEYWKRNPDFRLGQIVSNLSNQSGFSIDIFYIEDDIIENFLLKELGVSDMLINSSNSEE